MKKMMIILMIVTSLLARSQDYKNHRDNFFNNSNGELSLHLYSKSDELGPYIVYMVIEDLHSNDIKMIDRWNELSQDVRMKVVNRWAHEGKRIESLRPGTDGEYCIFPPKFPKLLKKPVLLPQPPPVQPLHNPWKI